MKSRLARQGIKFSSLDDKEKTRLCSENAALHPFIIPWFPPHWLVWVCYGAPKGNGRPEFMSTQMAHLVKIKAPSRTLSPEQMAREMSTMNKSTRRSYNAGGDEVNDTGIVDEVSVAESQNVVPREITFLRKVQPIEMSANDEIDRAILALEKRLILWKD